MWVSMNMFTVNRTTVSAVCRVDRLAVLLAMP